MKPVLAFDMNGTLTDTSALDPFFQQLFSSADRRREWFEQLIQLAMIATITGYFAPFGTLAQAALQMIGERHNVLVTDGHKQELNERVQVLSLFPDVEPALQRLHEAGFRLLVLTNSSQAAAEQMVERNGVSHLFEKVLSVETVKVYKPSPQVYLAAAREMSVAPGEILLVAAHSFDTTGAIRAGCEAAFIERPGEALDASGPTPRIIAADFGDLADQLIAEAKA